MSDVQRNSACMMDAERVKIPAETVTASTMLFCTGFAHNMPYTEFTILQVYQKVSDIYIYIYIHPCVMKKPLVLCHWNVAN
jgi:hypothetical protein